MKTLGIVLAFVMLAGTAQARDARRPHGPPIVPPKPPPPCVKDKDPGKPCTQTINIGDPLGIGGKLRTLSMLGFLERANEELERATLEKKSFVPNLVRSVEEEAL